jgi:hypothetical protein
LRLAWAKSVKPYREITKEKSSRGRSSCFAREKKRRKNGRGREKVKGKEKKRKRKKKVSYGHN